MQPPADTLQRRYAASPCLCSEPQYQDYKLLTQGCLTEPEKHCWSPRAQEIQPLSETAHVAQGDQISQAFTYFPGLPTSRHTPGRLQQCCQASQRLRGILTGASDSHQKPYLFQPSFVQRRNLAANCSDGRPPSTGIVTVHASAVALFEADLWKARRKLQTVLLCILRLDANPQQLSDTSSQMMHFHWTYSPT